VKTIILSTQKVKIYKAINLIIWIVFLLLILFGLSDLDEGFGFEHIRWSLYWSVGFYILFLKRTSKLKNISYDHENIYVFKGDQEIIIPFNEIKNIELKSLLGTHCIKFYHDLGLGKEIYFKSSLWYPLNFKKVDEQVYKLQLRIDNDKRKGQSQPSTKSLGTYGV